MTTKRSRLRKGNTGTGKTVAKRKDTRKVRKAAMAKEMANAAKAEVAPAAAKKAAPAKKKAAAKSAK